MNYNLKWMGQLRITDLFSSESEVHSATNFSVLITLQGKVYLSYSIFLWAVLYSFCHLRGLPLFLCAGHLLIFSFPSTSVSVSTHQQWSIIHAHKRLMYTCLEHSTPFLPLPHCLTCKMATWLNNLSWLTSSQTWPWFPMDRNMNLRVSRYQY